MKGCCEQWFKDQHEPKQYTSVQLPRWSGWSFLASNERKLYDIYDNNCCEHLFQDLHQSKQHASVKPYDWSEWSFLASHKRMLCEFAPKN